MASRSEIERTRVSLIRKADRETLKSVRGVNGKMLRFLVSALVGFDQDPDGRLKFTVANINKAGKLSTRIQSMHDQNLNSFGNKIVKFMLRVFGVNTKQFRAQDTPKNVTGTIKDRAKRRLFANYGFDTKSGILDPNGRLIKNLRVPGHADAILDRISTAVSGKVPLKDFIQTFQADFQRPGSPLSYEHHFKTFARDLYQGFDRQTQLEYRDELGLTHAIYSGTAKDNTRDFCLDRLNRIYTSEFIDGWNSLEWKGKKPGPVQVHLGGYNCRHVLSWISEETANQLLKRRNIDVDTYN